MAARDSYGRLLALQLDELISREYPLEQINAAFDALRNGEVARSIVRFI